MTLVAFGFDGTLIGSDLAVLLGREHGVGNEIQGLAEQGPRGEVSLDTTLCQRGSLLEGMPKARVDAAFDRCALRDGVADLIADLRRSDVSVAIVTGSFKRGVEAVLERAGVAADHVVANRLVMERGALTGDVEGALFNRGRGQVLEELAAIEGVALGGTFAVGSGATDLPMFYVAGTAIGFDPDPVVEDCCDVVVPSIRKLRLHFEQRGVASGP